MIPVIFSLLANLWVYKIFFTNFILGILIVISSILLSNRKFWLFLFSLIPILLIQVTTTQKASLTEIGNDDRREIDLRLRAYPPSVLRIGYWIEERKESIALSRITNNFFENLDPNLYFFANSPRARVGIKEFEKFPYVLFPVFVLGVLRLIGKEKKSFWILTLFLPLFILSFIGNKNQLGPFSLLPFLVISISDGVGVLYAKTGNSRKLKILLLAVLIMVIIQMIAYEIS